LPDFTVRSIAVFCVPTQRRVAAGSGVKRERLNLVSFGDTSDAGLFDGALRRLGHDPVCVPAVQWLDTSRQNHPCGAYVLYFADPAFPANQVLDVLEKRQQPVFAVFQCSELPVQPAIAEQARDFICWPCSDDELATRVQRFLGSPVATMSEIADEHMLAEFAPLSLVGRSRPFIDTLRRLKRLARCDVPVLIEGETGTGKELAARAIHYLGVRKEHPFVPVNCGAIPENLVENELFGHERGAFTDAKDAQQGLITQAEGGTLFLDEVETLSAKAQGALLRFLQDHTYRPLGSRRQMRANVRIVAASNCSLESMVDARQFRQDLLYRLRVMAVTMPSLRDRPGDAELLAEHFLKRYCEQHETGHLRLDVGTRQWIRHYTWPGNVRELENLLLRETLLAEGDILRLGFTPAQEERRQGTGDRRQNRHAGTMRSAKSRVIAEFERSFLCRLIAEAQGNVSAAARLAGKERRAFGRLLLKHGIDKNKY
jgi:DNA-binding NtrC family response regulator